MKFSDLKIKEYKYWDAMLHHNQCYLGRSVVWCKRNNVEDFLDMNPEELKEFWEISKKLRDAIKKAFNSDLINYASFSNVTKHLHFHIIPRYNKKRIFEGFEFTDENFGNSPFPYDNNFEIDKELKAKIIKEIRKYL